ncbi:Yip1 family protein [Streptomyces sp. CBMA29]|uniref:Yip1 family protein n=1 Tax=Streptomyces sp. CBMA29 TaxID=1896314 RepID=UPI001661BC63|nr:YIP1 family protein [Streptomyces sp. CBMA29]MBD0739428.1 hypothetical protein [Streptomyces sp. CBMA29]
MAGFRNRRGEGGGRGGRPGQGPGYGSGHGQGAYGTPPGEPEYYAPAAGQPGGYDESPGQTKAFTLGAGFAGQGGQEPYVDPYAGQQPYGQPSHAQTPYTQPPYSGDDNVATYRAGQSAAPPVGPRLHWKQLLSGVVLRPGRTFWQMRDHTVWGPALTVTFLYGLLAVFGFDAARSDVLDATLTTSIPWVLTTAVAVVISAVTLGAVTNTLARQFGGDGAWAPTIGLSLLITTLTDAPRLFFALFLGGANSFVQLLGWLTWLGCAALLTSMVSKSHDLPWPKALGAASIQLIALLCLFKLPLI